MIDKIGLANMNLHIEINIYHDTRVLRVINGWIYKFYENLPDENDSDHITARLVSTCFVPGV